MLKKNQLYESVLATCKVEGLTPSDDAQKWSQMYLNGTLLPDQVRKLIFSKYGVMKPCVK